ncbi:hypothetical protein MKEN_01094300 [Mycena kentingensis (nom. inval.)]|nr:hypothetical protein MKEN_01094300 [Mycena kentingensis (nom. inval.)]
MGRALLSKRYGSTATAAATQTPQPTVVDPEPVQYDKWSISNRFDPESDEFWANAQWETFIDREEVPHVENPVLDDVFLSESSSESSSSGRGTPEADSDSDAGRDAASTTPSLPLWNVGDQLLAQIQQLATVHAEAGGDIITVRADAQEPVPVPVLQNGVSVEPATPPSQTIALPSTPPMTHVLSPSPAPTVTPRIYVWNRAAPGSPGSPSVRYTHPAAGPLTNPSARQSFAHITPRRLVQNA